MIMKKFCTSCGHSNEDVNKVCVECGQKFIREEDKESMNLPNNTPVPDKIKRPMTLKNKIFTGIGFLVVVLVIGLYTWGTNTASAETSVTKFFDALQSNDAENLSTQVVFANGKKLTIKEAKAFISLYKYISPDELNSIATVEKSGKVIGLFDAHKVVLTPQKLSYTFPYDGLTFKLNGESINGSRNENDEYIFAGITPGIHKAEFGYKGEFSEFKHPFELTVHQQRDSSIISTIDEELIIETVSFGLENYSNVENLNSHIILSGKKIPLNQDGQTEEVGPILLDGSLSAQAVMEFPWGSQTSEAQPVIESYHSFYIDKLTEGQEEALVKQLVLFAEEYVEALATRDATIFTTITDEKLKGFKEEFDYMKSNDEFFKGSLTKINLDEESIRILEDGYSVNLNAEVVFSGSNYYQSEQPLLDEIMHEASIDFTYDSSNNKWVVDEYKTDNWFMDITASKTIEGSKKVYQTAGSRTATVNVSGNSTTDISAESKEIQEYFTEYNTLSVNAINKGDFSLVSHLTTLDGPRREEQSEFIDQLYSEGITEEHISTTVEKVEKISDNVWQVTTIERFVINGSESSSEKTYRTVNNIKKGNSLWLVDELITTTEI